MFFIKKTLNILIILIIPTLSPLVYIACVQAISPSYPSQSMISGPSNENGSAASGSDFIL